MPPVDIVSARRDAQHYLQPFLDFSYRRADFVAGLMTSPGHVIVTPPAIQDAMRHVAWAGAVSSSRNSGVPRYYLPIEGSVVKNREVDDVEKVLVDIKEYQDQDGLLSFGEAAIYFGLNKVAEEVAISFVPHKIFVSRSDGPNLPIEVTEIPSRQPGPVLIGVHGYRERASVNYATLSENYASSRGPVYWIHLPGHGGSGRIDNLPVYATDKDQYTSVLGPVFDWVAGRHPRRETTLLAHSLGGAVLMNALIDGNLDRHLGSVVKVILTAPMMALRGMGGRLYEQSRSGGRASRVFADSAIELLTRQKKVVPYKSDPRKTMKPVDPYGIERVLFQRVMGVSSAWDASKSPWLKVAYALMDGIQDPSRLNLLAKKLAGKPTRIILSPQDPVVDGPKIKGLIESVGSGDMVVDPFEGEVHRVIDSVGGEALVTGYLGVTPALRIYTLR